MNISLFDLFYLLCGLAIFLYGMQQGEKILKRLGGSDLRRILKVITRHRLSAWFAGLVTTLITQSSSATTVVLVSLASARLMSFGQSLGMILGSDLGTTVTVQLFAFKFDQIAPLLIAAGFFISMRRSSEKVSGYGKLILALGFIFFGMSIMAEAVMPLRSFPAFESMMQASLNNRWYGFLAGTVITAVIQSSAATLALLIALAENYSLSGDWVPSAAHLFPIILGANLGTCITAFISTIRADIEGVRVAWAHFLFKFAGVLIFFPLLGFFNLFDTIFVGSAAFQTAALHTFFNLFISFLFLPFTGFFERIILFMIKPGSKVIERFQLSYLHDSIISLPVLALSQAVREIEGMSEKVKLMLNKSWRLIEKFDLNNKRELIESDDEIDFLHENIIAFLTRMAGEELINETASRSYELIMITTDLEHIGDIISKSIVPLTEKIYESPVPLSAEGKREILEFLDRIIINFEDALVAFASNDPIRAQIVLDRKHEIKTIYNQMFDRHMSRLYKNKAQSLQTTSIHVDLLEEICRINHFTTRITAGCLKTDFNNK